MKIDKNLTFKNYKEPLKPVKNGHGYYGAILMTKDGDKIQCHICGELFKNLSGHVRQKHKTSIPDYKTMFQLAKSTALISETERWRLKKRTVTWMKNLTPEERKENGRKARESRKQKQPKISLETKNKRGTCPDQLLDQIKKVAKDIGRTPTKKEFIEETGTQRFVHLIYKVYGSWGNAIKLAKLKKHIKVENNGGGRRIDTETLLEYLRIFAQENNRVPTVTDFRRGLLPSYSVYTRRFGSIENARQEANIYDFID